MQIWNNLENEWNFDNDRFQKAYLKYRKTNPDFRLFCIDLSGYGKLSIPEGDSRVVNIGGFSDKIFDVFKIFMENGQNPVKMIDEYENA